MAFWRDGLATEPRRKHRFQVRFFNAIGSELESFYAKTITKPSMTVNVVSHKYLGHTFKFPGNVEWADCEATFVDVDKTAVSFLKRIRDGGYNPPRDGNETTTISKKKAVGAVGTVEILSLGEGEIPGGVADIVDRWILHNVWISKLGFGDLDYSNDELLEVSATLTYDWAEYQNDNLTPPIFS